MVGLQIVSILTLLIICSTGFVFHQCGDNTHYLKSASICRPFCNQDPKELQAQHCKTRYVSGCFCLPGYIKPAIDSVNCIPEKDCARFPTCNVNETYKECGDLFLRDCRDLSVKVNRARCHEGCDCKDGYVRISNGFKNNCVLESECWKYETRE